MMLWPAERAHEVLSTWLEWTRTAPEAATTAARVMNFPPLPELPDFLRGRSVVVIDGAIVSDTVDPEGGADGRTRSRGAIVGDDVDGAAVLAPLRALAPELDTFAHVPPAALSRIHMDPEEPVPSAGHGELLGELDAGAVDAWLSAAGGALLFTEIRHLGGALGRVPEGSGVVGRLRGEYGTFAAGMVMSPEMGEAVHAGLARFAAAMSPWANGANYLNFTEARVDPASFYAPEDYARLQAVRADVDPDGVLLANHEIDAA
jgi:hypothetical protein